jgi:hypothetical protein
MNWMRRSEFFSAHFGANDTGYTDFRDSSQATQSETRTTIWPAFILLGSSRD